MEKLDPQYEWLNKQQVAELLGKSEKAVQRYTASGELIATYIQESGFKRAYYRADDVKRFQQQDRQPKKKAPAPPDTVDTTDTVVKVSTVDSKSLVQGNHNPEKIIADLVGRVLNEAQKRGLFNLGAPGATSPASNAKEKPTVPIADKMVLSISKAAALSGRPVVELRKAFLSGKLHGVKLGRGIKVRREDLKLYIDGLFAKF